MVRYLKDNLYQPPDLQLWNPLIDVGLGKILLEIPPIFPAPSNKHDPFGPLPKTPQQPPHSVPQGSAPPILPVPPFITLPGSPGFGEPPKISPQQVRPPHEVDPRSKIPTTIRISIPIFS